MISNFNQIHIITMVNVWNQMCLWCWMWVAYCFMTHSTKRCSVTTRLNPSITRDWGYSPVGSPYFHNIDDFHICIKAAWYIDGRYGLNILYIRYFICTLIILCPFYSLLHPCMKIFFYYSSKKNCESFMLFINEYIKLDKRITELILHVIYQKM